MLGIIIGVASVIAMPGIGQGSKQSIQSEISGMGSNMLIVQPGRERFRGAMLSSSATETLTLDDYEAIRMTSQWFHAEQIRDKLEKARMESELSNLKNQLSPHCFFNTLNNTPLRDLKPTPWITF